ncbi:MAG: M23 family metallopeptidase [bacterium]
MPIQAPGPVPPLPGAPHPPRKHRRLLAVLCTVTATVLLLVLVLPRRRPEVPAPLPEPALRSVPHVVGRGNVLSTLLGRVGLDPAPAARVVEALRAAGFNLRAMRPGDTLTALYSDSALVRLLYARDRENVYRIDLDSTSCRVSMLVRKVTFAPEVAAGVITGSLYETVVRLGQNPALAGDFADVFGWEIDFFTEVQPGDSFVLLFLRKFVDSVPAGLGPILAARYDGQVGSFDAYRFTDRDGESGLYNSSGQSLRKQFLKSPLRFSRISSFFGSRRHPVLRVRRQHHGLDYVAPKGTPVSAAADGRVTSAGWSGGYGRMVEVGHANGYVTRYGHLSGFARGIRRGAAVKQGELIGFVGSTGLSTGPHLHYEIRKNGASVNPLRLDPPREPPVRKAHAADFARTRDSLARLMDRLR